MKEFYDGEKRPKKFGDWSCKDLDRICYNCGQSFGHHNGYNCPRKC